MKELKLNEKVIDIWYMDWGVGTVVKVLKTRAYIQFSNRRVVARYDKTHYQFLRSAE